MVVFKQRLSRIVLRRRILAAVSAFVLFSAIPRTAKADLLFEGYSKILLSGVHVGFTIQRFEFDSKKKEFISTSFLKTNASGGNITESIQSRATATLKPVSYKYTTLVGEQVKMIDATFKDDTISATVVDGGRRTTLAPRKIPKDVFLSSFLGYMMLQGKEGIKPQIRYAYSAIAEEDGQIYKGEALISTEEAYSGVSAFKVLNTFKGSQFISWITSKGEVLATRSPVQQIGTELVGTIQEATAGLPVNSTVLTQLFGSIPKGTENVIARKSPGTPLAAPAATPAAIQTAPAATPAPTKEEILNGALDKKVEEPGKKEGVPAGKGLILKGGKKTQ